MASSASILMLILIAILPFPFPFPFQFQFLFDAVSAFLFWLFDFLLCCAFPYLVFLYIYFYFGFFCAFLFLFVLLAACVLVNRRSTLIARQRLSWQHMRRLYHFSDAHKSFEYCFPCLVFVRALTPTCTFSNTNTHTQKKKLRRPGSEKIRSHWPANT